MLWLDTGHETGYDNVAADAHDVVTDVSPNWLNINCTSAGQKVQTTVNFMIQFPSNLIIISLQRRLPVQL